MSDGSLSISPGRGCWPPGSRPIGSGCRRRETELARLEQARAAQLARLMAERLELRRLELLQTRQERRRLAEALRRERKGLDELALLARGTGR